MQVKAMTVGMRGFDTYQSDLTHDDYADMKARGYDFVVRYYANLTGTEIANILDVGLGLLFVSTAKSFSNPVPRLRSLGVPPGVHVFADLEGETREPQPIQNDLNSFSKNLYDAQFRAGLYYGAGCVLTGAEMYALPWFTAYWESCSNERDRFGAAVMPSRGRSLIQLYPPNITVGHFKIDANVVQQDEKGRTPYMLIK